MPEKKECPIERNLDGAYFRVERDGKRTNRCFSDLTMEEQDSVMAEYNADQLRRLCHILSDALRQIGEELNLCREVE